MKKVDFCSYMLLTIVLRKIGASLQKIFNLFMIGSVFLLQLVPEHIVMTREEVTELLAR